MHIRIRINKQYNIIRNSKIKQSQLLKLHTSSSNAFKLFVLYWFNCKSEEWTSVLAICQDCGCLMEVMLTISHHSNSRQTSVSKKKKSTLLTSPTMSKVI